MYKNPSDRFKCQLEGLEGFLAFLGEGRVKTFVRAWLARWVPGRSNLPASVAIWLHVRPGVELCWIALSDFLRGRILTYFPVQPHNKRFHGALQHSIEQSYLRMSQIALWAFFAGTNSNLVRRKQSLGAFRHSIDAVSPIIASNMWKHSWSYTLGQNRLRSNFLCLNVSPKSSQVFTGPSWVTEFLRPLK